jgi:hypothetical protein
VGILGLRLLALSERSALWTFVIAVPYVTALFLILSIAPIPGLTVGLAAVIGVGAGLLFGALSVVVRKVARVPVGPDGKTRVAAYKVIMSGGPVPGELAPAVVWQADMILKRPYRPGLTWTAFGLTVGGSGLLLLLSILEHDARRTVWNAVLTVGFIVAMLAFSQTKDRRRRAELARHQALFVLNQVR